MWSRGLSASMLFLGATCATGCTVRETRSYTLPQQVSQAATWSGRSESEVLAAWGQPDRRESDGLGGVLLLYEHKTSVTSSVGQGPGTSPSLETPVPQAGAARTQEFVRQKAKFWIGPDGRVYRFWFSPTVFAEDKDTPPPRGADPDPPGAE